MCTIKENHWLKWTGAVKHLSCFKNKKGFSTGMPNTIIIHYTAGRDAITGKLFMQG